MPEIRRRSVVLFEYRSHRGGGFDVDGGGWSTGMRRQRLPICVWSCLFQALECFADMNGIREPHGQLTLAFYRTHCYHRTYAFNRVGCFDD